MSDDAGRKASQGHVAEPQEIATIAYCNTCSGMIVRTRYESDWHHVGLSGERV